MQSGRGSRCLPGVLESHVDRRSYYKPPPGLSTFRMQAFCHIAGDKTTAVQFLFLIRVVSAINPTSLTGGHAFLKSSP